MNIYHLPNGDIELGDYPYRMDEKWCNIVWIINEHCNLRCPYCVTGLRRATGSNATIMDTLGIDTIIDNLKKIRQSSGKNLYLTLTGGEPTLANNFVEFSQKLVKNDFIIELQTNLVSKPVIDFINKVDPSGVAQITASYHGHLLDTKEVWHKKYIDNCTKAIDNGHTCIVKIVATPDEIEKDLEKKVEKLENELPDETPILVWNYIKGRPESPGNYNGAYPYSYSEKEKVVLNKVIKYRKVVQKMYRDGAGFFKGIQCGAGHRFVVAYANGVIVRCLPIGKNEIVGDLKEGVLKMNSCSKQCQKEYCGTTFWPLWYADNPEVYIKND